MNKNKPIIAPSTGATRIALLDIFRGFALLGIYMVNIRYMASSALHIEPFQWMTEGTSNRIATWIFQYFFDSKFYPIFSFLFGVGFGMQINKMEEKGNFSNFFFIRRYFFLLLFGVFHVIFLWGGDVLILYAIAGYCVLLIRKVPVKYILIGSILILLCPFYGHLLNYLNKFLITHGYNSITELRNYTYQDFFNIHHGNFIDKLKYRLHEYSVYYRNVEYFPSLLFMIFGGFIAGKYKFYNKIPETLHRLTYVAAAALVVIIIIRIIDASYRDMIDDNYKLYVVIIT